MLVESGAVASLDWNLKKFGRRMKMDKGAQKRKKEGEEEDVEKEEMFAERKRARNKLRKLRRKESKKQSVAVAAEGKGKDEDPLEEDKTLVSAGKDAAEEDAAEEDAAEEDEAQTEDKQMHAAPRYILFVGNLRYSTTADQIEAHFKTLTGSKPVSVRLLNQKLGPGRQEAKGQQQQSRGIAFVEFNNSVEHHEGLKLHHSVLDGREINVEYTVGGGGNSASRVKKIEEKRESLTNRRLSKAQTKVKAQKAAANSQEVAYQNRNNRE